MRTLYSSHYRCHHFTSTLNRQRNSLTQEFSRSPVISKNCKQKSLVIHYSLHNARPASRTPSIFTSMEFEIRASLISPAGILSYWFLNPFCFNIHNTGGISFNFRSLRCEALNKKFRFSMQLYVASCLLVIFFSSS